MEDIHNKHKRFDWYATFIAELLQHSRTYFTAGSTIVNTFVWSDTIQGHNYWSRIHASLMAANYELSESETLILRQDALDFYKPIYEKLKLNHPELFI